MQGRIHRGCLRKVLSFQIIVVFLKEITYGQKKEYILTTYLFLIMLKLDAIGTLVMMILVDLMPIAKREMMLPYAHAHQVDAMTKNNDKML